MSLVGGINLETPLFIGVFWWSAEDSVFHGLQLGTGVAFLAKDLSKIFVDVRVIIYHQDPIFCICRFHQISCRETLG